MTDFGILVHEQWVNGWIRKVEHDNELCVFLRLKGGVYGGSC